MVTSGKRVNRCFEQTGASAGGFEDAHEQISHFSDTDVLGADARLADDREEVVEVSFAVGRACRQDRFECVVHRCHAPDCGYQRAVTRFRS